MKVTRQSQGYATAQFEVVIYASLIRKKDGKVRFYYKFPAKPSYLISL